MKRTHEYALRITGFFVKNNILSETRALDLQRALANDPHIVFDTFVLEEGFVTKPDLLKALGIYYNLPTFDAEGYFFSHFLLRMFPKDIMIKNGFIPLDIDGEILTVIAAPPFDYKLQEIVNRYVSYNITFLIGLYRDIVGAIEEFYDLAPTVDPEIVHDIDIDQEKAETEQSAYTLIDDREEPS